MMVRLTAWCSCRDQPCNSLCFALILLHCTGCPGCAHVLTALPAAFPQGTCHTNYCRLNHWIDVFCSFPMP